MKVLCSIAAISLLAAPLFSQTPAPAQHALPACNGVINVVRVSEITPTGSVDKFMAAVAAHQAWYKSHGYSDVIVASRILEFDPQTHAASYSDKRFLTFHYEQPNGPEPKHDADWDAYVKLYQATSIIKETTIGCTPLAAAPASLQ